MGLRGDHVAQIDHRVRQALGAGGALVSQHIDHPFDRYQGGLNECAELFATDETFPKGRFLDYPAEWVVHNEDRIEALDLNYVPVRSSGEGSLITEIESAYARKAPLLVMFWTPHWILSKFDLKRVKLPTHEVECQTDPG